MQKGNLTLDSKFTQMRKQIREAIANAFNTSEMIKVFGEHDVTELLTQLSKLNEDLKLKRISSEEAEKNKVDLSISLIGFFNLLLVYFIVDKSTAEVKKAWTFNFCRRFKILTRKKSTILTSRR